MALAAALALSGVPLEDLTNEFQDGVIDAILILKKSKTPDPSPSTSPDSSTPTSPTSSCFSDNSEISSSTKKISSSAICRRSFTHYQFDMIDDFFTNMDFLSQFPYDLQFSFCDRKVLYQNRDLMDLAGNLRETSNWMCRPSDCSSTNESSEISLQTFSDSFYSKSPVGDRPGSLQCMVSCSENDCSFTEPALDEQFEGTLNQIL
ncbi:unnamed protein product [Phyllotreta striolata]|uniref:Uncharacterized protein n=1 Tax=Phyllotreta striolata TaxID=444603 RepID=A0A9N9TYB8_PHYSR|nr:unnamed protein product [Phyllotreta striolata]